MICLRSYEVDSKNSLGLWDIVTSFYIPIYDLKQWLIKTEFSC